MVTWSGDERRLRAEDYPPPERLRPARRRFISICIVGGLGRALNDFSGICLFVMGFS